MGLDRTGILDDGANVGALSCAQCGYDLRSQAKSGLCPECGAQVSAAVVTPVLRIGSWVLVRRVRSSLAIIVLAVLVHTLFSIAYVMLMLYWFHINDRTLRVRMVHFFSNSPAFTEAAVTLGVLVFVIGAMSVRGVLRRWYGWLIIIFVLFVVAGQISAAWVYPSDVYWLETRPKRILAGLLWVADGGSSLLIPLIPALLLRMLSQTGSRRIKACTWVGFVGSLFFAVQALVEMGWCLVLAATARAEPGKWMTEIQSDIPPWGEALYFWFYGSERSVGAVCWVVVLCAMLIFLRASTPPHAARCDGPLTRE